MLIILSTVNFIYVSTNPELTNNMVLGVITGMIVTIIAVGVVAGFNFLGSGLTDASVKILFGVGSIINILFRLDVSSYPIGLGFINNLYDVFGSGDSWGIGLFLCSVISITTLASGLIMIIGGD